MSLRGSTTEFPLDVLLRLLGDQKKTGELSLRGAKGEGALGLAEGRVVTAVYREEKPIPALGAIFALGDVDFEFVPWTDAPAANLEGDLEQNLKKADDYAKWLADVREVIPHDGIRFRLSERAADQGAVTFTSDRWRVVMAVNTRPSVTELASNLHIDRDEALTTLAGLVRDGVIETIDEPAPTPPSPAPAPGPPASAGMAFSDTSAAQAAPSSAPTPEQFPEEDWTAALVRRAAEQTEPEPPAREAEAAARTPEPPASEPEPFRSAPPAPSAPVSSAAPADAWSAIPTQPAPPPDTSAPAPMPDWTSSSAAPIPEWTPASSAPPAQDWSAVPTQPLAPEEPSATPAPPDWTSSPATSSQEWTASTTPWSATPPPPADWTTTPSASDKAFTTPPPAFTPQAPSFAPQTPDSFAPAEPRADAAPSQDWGAPAPAEPAPMDDRLAALQGMFNTPAAAQPADTWVKPAADTWNTPAAPADPRLAAMNAPAPAPAETAPAKPAANEWAPPPSIGGPAQKKGSGIFGGLFGRKGASADPAAGASSNGGAGSRAGKLAAFSNALLAEYTSGAYGKGKVDDRMPSLLMRVDEQADPIDRPLPIVDDRLDVQALERVQLAEQQAVPYLATLVSTIYGDAEKAFGKDKAKRGYKAAQQQVFGADASTLSGPDVAGKLPKV